MILPPDWSNENLSFSNIIFFENPQRPRYIGIQAGGHGGIRGPLLI